MAYSIPQSVAKRINLKAYLSDGATEATGKTVAITISKNGGAFGNPAAGATNATELANGWYYVDLAAGDFDTLGPIVVRGTATGVDNTERLFYVVNAYNGGFTGVPGAAAESAGGLFTRGTGAGQINQEDNGYISVNLKAILRTVLTETAPGYLSAAFKKLFDVASPALTSASKDQTGDNYARLGAPAGASISADIQTRATPADVQTSVAVSVATATTVSSGSLAIVAGTTFRESITSTLSNDLSAATQIELAFKTSKTKLDAESTVLIKLSGGLVYLNGAAYGTAAHGSLTVTGSSGAWSVAIYIDEVATAQLFGVNNTRMFAGMKAKVGSDWLDVWTDTRNASTITDGVVRDVS